MPSLLVNADGTASAAFETDRFTIRQLRDADGSAVMVHAGPDNFANIPPRYGTPDDETSTPATPAIAHPAASSVDEAAAR